MSKSITYLGIAAALLSSVGCGDSAFTQGADDGGPADASSSSDAGLYC